MLLDLLEAIQNCQDQSFRREWSRDFGFEIASVFAEWSPGDCDCRHKDSIRPRLYPTLFEVRAPSQPAILNPAALDGHIHETLKHEACTKKRTTHQASNVEPDSLGPGLISTGPPASPCLKLFATRAPPAQVCCCVALGFPA